MILKSLKLKNFRQYVGEQEIKFSSDKNNNVTIILGDNTSGKTTLLQAFNWCLYGVAVFDTKDFLLNLNIAQSMKPSDNEVVEVKLTLEHGNLEYEIYRKQRYVVNLRGKVIGENPEVSVTYKGVDGITHTIKDIYISSKIKEILPQDLADYFFFDTERIGSISEKKNIAEAVKGLLGITVLLNAKEHLGKGSKTVLGKFNASLDIEGNSKVADIRNVIEQKNERKKVISEELQNCESQISDYDERKQQLESKLREYKPTAELQKSIEKLEEKVVQEKKYLEESYNQFKLNFNAGVINYFIQPLLNDAESILQEANIEDKGIRDMNANSINDLIKRGVCLCGAKIEKGNEAYKHIMEELKYLPPASLGTLIKNFKEKISLYKTNNSNKQYYANLDSKYKEIYKCKNNIDEWEEEISEKYDGLKVKDMTPVIKELEYCKENIKRFNEKRDNYLKEAGLLEGEINRLEKQYNKLISQTSKNKKIQEYIKYTEAIYEWINKTCIEKEKNIRANLEKEVNNIFIKMYHGSRIVKIDENYRIKLLTTYEENNFETDESKGLETVKNFAFIGGLVKLASEQVNDKKEMDLGVESYPLVMDAPFSNADEKHVKNISKILPEVAEQIIMFVMEKDWNYAKEVMGNKVGKKYYLDKHSETLTYIKGVE